jgi:hypothetical protein
VGFKVVSLYCLARRFPCFSLDDHPQAPVVLFPCSLSQGFQKATMEIALFVLSLLICSLTPRCIARGGVLHDRSLSAVARDESCIARDKSCKARDASSMARDESRMARNESCMAGNYCWPDTSIHRGVHKHLHLYSYIYGLVPLLHNLQSSFSIITI